LNPASATLAVFDVVIVQELQQVER